MTTDMPRRANVLKLAPAEESIRLAMVEVEKMPPHTLLTDAVVLLQQAQTKVADYVDGLEKQKEAERLHALAKRLIEAKGQSDELNWLIAEHLGEIPEHLVLERGWSHDWWRQPNDFGLWRAKDSEGRNVETWSPKNRTGSTDEALTLVPDGWFAEGALGSPAYISIKELISGHELADAQAATSPLAICAATLSALARSMT